ncbi:MAG: serine protease [Clostridia bacterium]|nr:serine protease [Clostridia bacterium]
MKKLLKLIFSALMVVSISITTLVGCITPNTKYVTSIEQTAITADGIVYTITYSDDTTSTFTVYNGQKGEDGRSIVSIDKTSSSNGVDTYTISYSDDTSSTFTVTNGKDGKDGKSIVSVDKTSSNNGVDTYTIFYSDDTSSTFTVTNGKDGDDLSITEVYDKYNETLAKDGQSPVTFEQFLEKFLTDSKDTAMVTAKCLLSSLAIYSEFIIHDDDTLATTDGVRALYTGSGVIYRMDSDYTYILTNFHVVYNGNTNTIFTDGSLYAQRLVGYMYGSEGVPYKEETFDAVGNHIGYSGSYLDLTVVGSSVNDDLALLKVPTAQVLAINENATAVTLASEYFVGETAIAIGDANSDGISTSKGVVSVDSEEIQLSVDETSVRDHRVMRIDTTIYPGNSGCGLFNERGELIGICNSGATEESINYAIPIDVVAPVARNLYHYHNDGDDSTNGLIICPLGISVQAVSSKYQYDASTGYGKIVEKIVVAGVVENSITSSLGLAVNDIITCFYIGDDAYKIDRTFNIYDIVVNLRVGDTVKATYLRNGTAHTSVAYTVTTDNLLYATL